MIGSFVESALARLSATTHRRAAASSVASRSIMTASGAVHLFDSGSDKPCVVFVPDGPNVVDHYAQLIPMLEHKFRVVCFDMPGFGYSLPVAADPVR